MKAQTNIRPNRRILSDMDLDHLNNDVTRDLMSSKLLWVNQLTNIIPEVCRLNPYRGIASHEQIDQNEDLCVSKKRGSKGDNSLYELMWLEQCWINFPLLYLASLYLHIYATEKNCDTFLFATRDCCHWIKIFTKMFPGSNYHYFHCSRNMFKKGGKAFKKYVTSIVGKDIKKVIYIDIHGTGYHVFSYFKKEFGGFPHCLLLSATAKNYEELPPVCQTAYKQDRLAVLVFSAAGTPIEMLNYDLIGTLQDYTKIGPIRDPPEYPINLLEPYHVCMNIFIDQCQPIKKRHRLRRTNDVIVHLETLIRKLYSIIQYNTPVIATYIEHQVKHSPGVENRTVYEEPSKVPQRYVHGLI
jgi:hypothetical protein